MPATPRPPRRRGGDRFGIGTEFTIDNGTPLTELVEEDELDAYAVDWAQDEA
jgi:hypothetical protein